MPTDTTAATYREIFRLREFRALFAAHLLSLIGDQLTKVAVAALVFTGTGSAFLAAVTFGIGYLPWVVLGPVLSALADRFPRRTVMIVSDAARMCLIALLVTPGLPVAVLIGVLFVSALLAPPAQAARSATMPEVLDGDKYVVAAGISSLTGQIAQMLGFAGGGLLLAVLSAREVLLIDAATFAISALLLARHLIRRPAPARAGAPTVLRSTADGFRLVTRDPQLRAYLLLGWAGAAFATAPEGLMTAYAQWVGGGDATVGLLLSAMPFGCMIGAIIYGRFTSPAARWRQVRPMALLSCLALVPIAAGPPLPVVLGLLALSGYGTAFQIALNARFVREVPGSHRARAFGVAAAGMMAGIGLATSLAGALTDLAGNPALIVGGCGLAGCLAMLPVARRWPAHLPAPTETAPRLRGVGDP
ncbi:MFS transporter [Nonomuraea sp. B10E15]|uniref:MFS transporter n=1 Tax=Nonomuraea sp. B10E15 TaxID=3153560 RepID=UPI00325EE19B